VLEWIFERCADRGDAVRTPIGWIPAASAIDTDGLDLAPGALDELLRVDVEEWKAEVPAIRGYYATFGDHLPAALADQLDGLERRLDGC